VSDRVRQRLRLAMVFSALLVIAVILYVARGVLTPFAVGVVVVLVFGPLVDAMARLLPFQPRHPELALSLSIALLYLILSAAAFLLMRWLGASLLSEGRDLADKLPALVDRVRSELQDRNGWYQQNVPADLRGQIDQNWQNAADQIGSYGQTVLSRTISFITGSLAAVISYIVVPFWVFFVLKDRERGTRAFVRLFPVAVQADVAQIVIDARDVFGSYIRAQLLLSTLTGVVTAVGLQLFGVQFAIILGVIAGVANLIPVLGPLIGGLPAIVVVAATHPGWQILWVFLFLFVSQELKDFILVPRVQGRAVRLHPAVILVMIVVAGHLYGFWGLLFAVPLAAVARDAFMYIYRRLGGLTSSGAAAADDSGG
jgi:predicted PurR-regulated permease PerM